MPVSAHCKDLLEKPVGKDACLDFRDTRARVMCQVWHIMDEEKVPFKEAVRISWDRSKKDCAAVGVFSPEPVEPRLSVDIVDAETGQRKGSYLTYGGWPRVGLRRARPMLYDR